MLEWRVMLTLSTRRWLWLLVFSCYFSCLSCLPVISSAATLTRWCGFLSAFRSSVFPLHPSVSVSGLWSTAVRLRWAFSYTVTEYRCVLCKFQHETRTAFSRVHTSPLTLTFQNLITLSPVAKCMADQVWWQSDLNWRQEVVVKHVYLYIYTYRSTYMPTPAQTTSHHLRCGR